MEPLTLFLLDELLEEDDDDAEVIALMEILDDVGGPPIGTDYYTEIIPQLSAQQYKAEFRLSREAVQALLDHMEQRIEETKEQVPLDKAIHILLWCAANMEPLRTIASRFAMSPSQCWRTISKTITKVYKLAPAFIHWPNADEKARIKAGFFEKSGIAEIVGAIDGSLVKTDPFQPHLRWFNGRKKMYAVNVQAVCDNRKAFIDIAAGWHGSAHDSRMLRNSAMFREFATKFGPTEFLVGDGGYPCMHWLVTPFRNNANTTNIQRAFNTQISRARVVIEQVSTSIICICLITFEFLDDLKDVWVMENEMA